MRTQHREQCPNLRLVNSGLQASGPHGCTVLAVANAIMLAAAVVAAVLATAGVVGIWCARHCPPCRFLTVFFCLRVIASWGSNARQW